MTLTIPKWLLALLLVLIVVGIGIGAYLLGQSSDEDPGPTAGETTSAAEEAATPPECSEVEAERAIPGTEFEAAVRELGVVPPDASLFKRFGFVIAKLACRDLTGDGAEEMLVQLGCCTGGSPSPWAIFTAEDGSWDLAFYRSNVQAGLSFEATTIVEKSPAYAAGDPTCCPSTFRFGEITWDGEEFVFESNEGSSARTIKASTQGVSRIGAFDPTVGSPLEAAEAFGPPSYVLPDDELCVNAWRDLGLLINFANLGGADPCSTEGRVGSVELKGEFAEQAGWETDEGVTVGMTARELRQTYPDAQEQSYPGLGNVLVLIEGPTVIGEGGTYPVLGARLADGEVEELRLSVGAAGD
jgi:hypothetical protein